MLHVLLKNGKADFQGFNKVGAGTTAVEFCSEGERLVSTLNTGRTWGFIAVSASFPIAETKYLPLATECRFIWLKISEF